MANLRSENQACIDSRKALLESLDLAHKKLLAADAEATHYTVMAANAISVIEDIRDALNNPDLSYLETIPVIAGILREYDQGDGKHA